MNFQMFKLDLEKAEEPEIKLPTSPGSSEKQEFQKNIYFCFTDHAKAFYCVDHNKLWKILKEMGLPDHLTCLLRKLYAGQEATVRTGHETTDWYQIGKVVHQGCILLPCLFNLCAEYITRNARLEELKSLLMKRKEEGKKVFLKLNIQKTKIMASGPITSLQIDGETMETVTDFVLGGSKITAVGDCSHEIKRHLLLGSNLDSILKSRGIKKKQKTETLLRQQRSI